MKYRLNAKKFTRFIIVVVLIIAAIATLVNGFSGDKYEIVDYTMYEVKSGDTLWGIASSINPGKDVRIVVYDIETMNIWDGAPVIKAGDVISIPVYDE